MCFCGHDSRWVRRGLESASFVADATGDDLIDGGAALHRSREPVCTFGSGASASSAVGDGRNTGGLCNARGLGGTDTSAAICAANQDSGCRRQESPSGGTRVRALRMIAELTVGLASEKLPLACVLASRPVSA
jgi:hypothetical protein